MLSPNALRILDTLGIYSQIRESGYSFEKATYRDEKGVLLGEYAFGGLQEWAYKALRVDRGQVLDVLEREVKAEGVEIVYDCAFSEVEGETEGGVWFNVHMGRKIERTLMQARKLIGCDGLHSKVRTWVVGAEVKPVYSGTVAVTATAQRSLLRYGEMEEAARKNEVPTQISTSNGSILMIPKSPDGNTIQLGRQFTLPEQDRAGWQNLGNDKAKLLQMFTSDMNKWPELPRSAMQQVREMDVGIWPYYSLPRLERWISENGDVVIIGDAAHTVIPAAGQGANQAFEDAWTLAKVLTKRMSLGKWEVKRQQRLDRVTKLSHQLMNIRLSQEEQWKLQPDMLFDLGGSDEEKVERMMWLYGIEEGL